MYCGGVRNARNARCYDEGSDTKVCVAMTVNRGNKVEHATCGLKCQRSGTSDCGEDMISNMDVDVSVTLHVQNNLARGGGMCGVRT